MSKRLPQDPPVQGRDEDSWAWHPEAKERGSAYYSAHFQPPSAPGSERVFAGPASLKALAAWLFERAPNDFGRLMGLHKKLETFNCDPEEPGAEERTMNTGLRTMWEADGGQGQAPALGHAQWVMLYHVLWKQEDVRLLAPYDPGAQAW